MAAPGSVSSWGGPIIGLGGMLGVALGACTFGPTGATSARPDAGGSADAATFDGPRIGASPIQCTAPADLQAAHLTGQGGPLRTGWYPDQPGLSPAIVGSSGFGRLFKTKLPLGTGNAGDAGAGDAGPAGPAGPAGEIVMAQPLVVGSTVFVVTESNNLYALDAETGAVKASRSLGQNLTGMDVTCGDLPAIGITGTPVIDAPSHTAFLFSKTFKSNMSAAAWYAHAVDVDSLAERPGFPVEIAGTASNDPSIIFNPLVESQRPGLLLLNGVVYAAFGSHCDQGPFHGFVVGVTTDGHQTPLFATEAGPSAKRGAGFWHSGGGIVSDGTGRLFLTASNGYSNAWGAPLPGNTPPQTLDQSAMRLDVKSDGSLVAKDFFAPYDGPTLDSNNVDFGSGGPIGLPDCFGTKAHPHLLTAAGKQGRIYILDRDDLGGYQQGPSQGDAIVSATDARDGLWSTPAVWPGEGGWMYIAPSGAPFQAFSYGFGTNGIPTLAPLGVTSDVFATFSGSPIVTSDGTTPGSALVWVYYSPGAWMSGALRAYLPIPDATGTLTPIFQDAFGMTAKFAAPGVGDNRLYVGTSDGYVLGYGAMTSASVSAKPVDFGMVGVGKTVTRGVVVSASQNTEIDAVASDNPTFFLAPGAPSWPAKIQAGASLTIPVGFTPAHAGGYAAALRLTTPDGLAAVSLQGSGQATGASLVVLPKSLAFEGIPPGQTEVLDLVLQNVGASPMQFTTVVTPRAPFAVMGAPGRGDVLASGQSITLTVAYTPPSPGQYSDSLELASNAGTRVIYFSGASATPGVLVLTPMTLAFGHVAVGSSKQMSFTVSDTGGTSLKISSSKPPTMSEFLANTDLGEGTIIAGGGGGMLTESVTFTPTSVGPAPTDYWQIGSTAGGNTSKITFTGTGVAGPVDAGTQ